VRGSLRVRVQLDRMTKIGPDRRRGKRLRLRDYDYAQRGRLLHHALFVGAALEPPSCYVGDQCDTEAYVGHQPDTEASQDYSTAWLHSVPLCKPYNPVVWLWSAHSEVHDAWPKLSGRTTCSQDQHALSVSSASQVLIHRGQWEPAALGYLKVRSILRGQPVFTTKGLGCFEHNLCVAPSSTSTGKRLNQQ